MEIDPRKVTRLTDTIIDFIRSSGLTSLEIDYVVNYVWARIQSDRVLINIVKSLEHAENVAKKQMPGVQ